MSKIHFEVNDEAVIKYTHIPGMPDDMYEAEIVMTKEIFQECYKKWVEPQESEENKEWYK